MSSIASASAQAEDVQISIVRMQSGVTREEAACVLAASQGDVVRALEMLWDKKTTPSERCQAPKQLEQLRAIQVTRIDMINLLTEGDEFPVILTGGITRVCFRIANVISEGYFIAIIRGAVRAPALYSGFASNRAMTSSWLIRVESCVGIQEVPLHCISNKPFVMEEFENWLMQWQRRKQDTPQQQQQRLFSIDPFEHCHMRIQRRIQEIMSNSLHHTFTTFNINPTRSSLMPRTNENIASGINTVFGVIPESRAAVPLKPAEEAPPLWVQHDGLLRCW